MKPTKEVALTAHSLADLEVGIGIAAMGPNRRLLPFALSPGDNLQFDVYRDDQIFMSIRDVDVLPGDKFPIALVRGRATLLPKPGTYRYALLLRRDNKRHLLAHGSFTVVS